MVVERLDIVDAEFLDNVRGKIGERHAREIGVAIMIVRSVDVRTERVRGDGDAIAGLGGKSDVGRRHAL